MINYKNMHNGNVFVAILSLILGLTIGCRDPEFEETPWRIDGFDPGSSEPGPAPLCPAGSEQPINNSYAPYVGGEKFPDLVVEIFTYFRCPNCAGLAMLIEEMMHRRQDIRDTVRIYFHHYPLYEHATAMKLHSNMEAIFRQDLEGFWELHDMVFAALLEKPPVLYEPDDMRQYAEDVLHLDMNVYDQVAESDDTMSYILWDKSQGEEMNMMGTPGIFICGKQMEGGWGNLEDAIDDYLY